MDEDQLTDVISTLLAAEEPEQAAFIIGLVTDHAATKARYLQLLDILHQPPREDLSGAYDALVARFEEQLKINEELNREVATGGRGKPLLAAEYPLESLYLDQRTLNVLEKEGIYTVGQLTAKTEVDLLKLPAMGKKSLAFIKTGLDNLGLGLAKTNHVTTSPGATVS